MQRPLIVGILNVTPDSYFDGGKFEETAHAVARAEELLRQGADIIEVGGESTGPTSAEVMEAEEIRRTIPVIKEIRRALPEARISIDTWKASVAASACAAGATMVNDVTAGRGDDNMFRVVSNVGASLVLMYAKDATPRTTIQPRSYDNVIETIKTFLAERKAKALAEGIVASNIILDPGLGHFVSSDPRYSFEILAKLSAFGDLGCPLFLSPSRKSFLAGTRNLPASYRLPATLAATAVAVLHGAGYIRTHDVAETREVIEATEKMSG